MGIFLFQVEKYSHNQKLDTAQI